MTAPIIRNRDALREIVTGWKRDGASVGVVPTMGALHEGHLSLVEAAKARADRVIVTIFVNPKQFNNPDDLAAYPRTEHADAKLLVPFEVDALYVPDGDQIYPEGFATTVTVAGLSAPLCGYHRPGHFEGVATVVTKLLLQTGADLAFFGEKDFQQLQVIRRLATDLDIPTEIIGCPTIREPDGLALSSRNARLSAEARMIAPALHARMQAVAKALRQGIPATEATRQAAADLVAAGFDSVEYLELRAATDLSQIEHPEDQSRLFAAAWIGGVRLIDNIAV